MMKPLPKKRIYAGVTSLFANLSFLIAFVRTACFVVIFLLTAITSMSQSLTISGSGQVGSSGTNWSSSGTNPRTITATAAANINTSVIQDLLNAGTSVIVINTNLGTAVNANISKTTGGNASLTIKDNGFMKIGANVSISSSAGALDIILWADQDNSQGGAVDDYLFCNPGTTFNSNGGKIVMAGGPDNGTNGGVSGDGIPDGFAWNGSNNVAYNSNDVGGLTLGPLSGTGTVVSLNSNGGEIILRGSTSNNNALPGITSQGNLKIESGTGKITMYGKSTTGHGVELTFGAPPAVVISSAATVSPAIDLKGITTSGAGYAGFWGSNNANGNILIQSTAASGGGVTIEGVSPANGLWFGVSGTNINTQVLSQSGTITLKGDGGANTSLILYGDTYIGNRKDANTVQGIAPAVTASSANILIQADDQYILGNTASKNTNFNSTGSLTVEAYTSSYGGTVSWAGNASFGSSFSSITMGESAENYSFTLNNSLAATGNITAYTSDFTLGNGVGLTSSGAGTINLNARGNFNTTGTTRRTLSSAGGDINVYADWDASGNGQLDIDYLTFNPGAGNIRLRTETMSWLTTLNTDKPYFNGTGTITIEPADAAFQGVWSHWFSFDQDANGMAGLTIGKSTNTGSVNFATDALTVAGPIAVYGGVVTFDVNLTSSANGNIFIKSNNNANTAATIVGNATIFKTAGTGTLTMQSQDRLNSGTITASGTGVLNVILWSDYDNDNNGGVAVGQVTTNGGRLWVGGSNSNGGSYTWNGLAVGDGPSVGSVNNNYNAIDFYGPVATNGGDVLIWGGNGYSSGTSGIAIMASGRSINAGSGNITLIGDNISSNDISIITTGTLSLVPDGGSYPSAVTWAGSLGGGNFNVSNTYDALTINSFANLGGLTIGYYDGQLSSGTPVIQNNTSNITVNNATSIAGSVRFQGTALSLTQNIASTGAGNISLFGNSLSIAGGAAITSTGNLIIEPITAATTIGIAGSGTLALTATNFSTNFTDGFAEIRVGNTSAGNITLGTALTIRDNLRLSTAGLMSLTEMMELGTNNFRFIGTSISPSAGKFVKTNGTGKLTMDIANNASKVYPIGTTYYNPLTVTNHTGATDAFYATVSDNVYQNGSTSGTPVIWNPKVNLTWNIGNTGASTGSGNVDLGFTWDAANASGVFTIPVLLHYAGGPYWQRQPATPAYNSGTRTLTYTGYTGSFSPFAIAENNITLPVGWLSFTGKLQEQAVVLDWSTANEQNNNYFEVERSSDAISFASMGRVSAGLQGIDKKNDYTFTDQDPLSGRSYYRLKQVDLDGKSSYSKIISINAAAAKGYSIIAVPGSGQVQVVAPQNLIKKTELTIYDAGGRKLTQQQLQAGRNNVNTGTLTTGGIYVATIREGNNIIYNGRFVY